jgi:hypothetical protein
MFLGFYRCGGLEFHVGAGVRCPGDDGWLLHLPAHVPGTSRLRRAPSWPYAHGPGDAAWPYGPSWPSWDARQYGLGPWARAGPPSGNMGPAASDVDLRGPDLCHSLPRPTTSRPDPCHSLPRPTTSHPCFRAYVTCHKMVCNGKLSEENS